ncbi:flagella basal body P-ring formation protein FlgA [Methylovirgula ligni]|uniref:Flagella basal body P-ring formation protein FlgA n=1 Tax=Methylovirgula ligni TaxID=569860 RepID=A0A3D9YZ07_9HYPH|nr:flagellar basal body P-ring formation chaperone FlgA [Methylovirgula ligni]QAY96191.1 flagella basal body P-ring formation protein FlgA [Methylovirgula ligni]REF86112.1 flagella basal body P-ring formation protein FlgA [Methylovirgula ligni]
MSRQPGRFSRLGGVGRHVALAGLLALFAVPACAGNVLPVPAVTIYPGDIIKENAIVDHDFGDGGPMRGAAIDSRAALIGKVARHTLLPGLAISFNAIGEPRLVADGQKVRVVFEQDGLVIETYAAALQAGGDGDVISVRNLDSGLTISGTVQADGSVRVGG